MKKLVFLLAGLCLLSGTINAQTEKKMWLGGNIGLSIRSQSELPNERTFKFQPEWGYTFNKHWAMGIYLNYNYNKTSQMGYSPEGFNTIDIQKQHGWGIGSFARFMFLKGSVGYLFVDGGAHYTHYCNSDSWYGLSDLASAGFRPGVAVKLSQSLILTGHFGFLGYQYEKRQGPMGYPNRYQYYDYHTVTADFSLDSFSLGLNVHF